MSQANVEAVRRAFEAIRERDVDALLRLFDPDVEVRSLLPEAERALYRVRGRADRLVRLLPHRREALAAVGAA